MLRPRNQRPPLNVYIPVDGYIRDPKRPEPSMKRFLSILAALLVGTVASSRPAAAEPPADFPFALGDRIDLAGSKKLQPWVPSQLWAHRDLYFFDGMEMEIGPSQRDYRPPELYRNASDANRGTPRLGPDGSLVGYVAGQPFPMDTLECTKT